MSVKVRTTVCGAVIAAVGIAAALPASAATPQPRATLDAAPSWTAKATAGSDASASQQLRMSVTLKLRNQAGAEALARAVSTPGSASYRKFVSADAWRSQYAPTDATVSSVESWLRANGFTIGAVPANHRTVAFTGTVAQAEKAFGTTLRTFVKDGASVIAPTSATTIPSSVAGAVAGVSGLDTSLRAHPNNVGGPAYRARGAVSAAATPADDLPAPPLVFLNAPPCSTYYGEKKATGVPQVAGLHPLTDVVCGYKPGQLRSAYTTAGALSQGLDGRGATVAIVDAYASPTIFNDASTYAARNDAQHPLRDYQFSQNLPASYNNTELCDAAGWYGEESLDVEAVHAMAPAASILYVGGASCFDNDLNAAVNTIVDNQLAQVISNSYGEPDSDENLAGLQAVYQIGLQAAAEGISLMFSSGDSGDDIAATGMRQTDSSASNPLVTAVGGTALAIGQDGSTLWTQGWGTGTSSLVNGAWSPLPPTFQSGGGGGESNVWGQPWYQKGVVPNAMAKQTDSGQKGRAVPDVSMVGDNATGFLIGQSQTFPNGQVKYSEYRLGGTSLSSPLYAGFTALMDQAIGGSLGFLNPLLYGLFYNSPAMLDVNHGRRVTDAVVRTNYLDTSDPTSGTARFLRTHNQTGTIYTRKGYDDVTGVGSPIGDVTLAFLQSQR
jgi:subtilase family serine protease